jgi:hypothetical protein
VRNVLWLLAAMTFRPRAARAAPALLDRHFCGIVIAWRAWIAFAACTFRRAGSSSADHRRHRRHLAHLSARPSARSGRGAPHRDVGPEAARDAHATRGDALDLSRVLPRAHELPLLAIDPARNLHAGLRVDLRRHDDRLQSHRQVPTLSERLRPAAALVVQALPLMAAFFLLFPRIQGPLWALPRDTTAGKTGSPIRWLPGR